MNRYNDEIKLKDAFSKEYNGIPDEALETIINQFYEDVDDRFSQYVNDYIETGIEHEYEYGSYSLMLIESLQKVGYLEAIRMLSVYMKDPVKGETLILRPMYGRRY